MPILKEAAEKAKKSDFKFNLGGCMVSNNILTGKGKLKWCYRHEPNPTNKVDNGWEFLSDVDTEEYLNISENWSVVSWDNMFFIEPSIVGIFDLPYGSDLIFIEDETGKYYYDAKTEEVVISFCLNEKENQ